MVSIPEFQTDRLLLIGVQPEHAASYEKHFVDYAVISQLAAAVPWPYPTNGVAEYIQTFMLPRQGQGYWFWGLFLKDNPDEMIGGISLWREGTPENRGFWLGQKFWGQGYMTEAVVPIMNHAFETLGFEKLVFSNALGNIRSRRVKEKTGARLIGIRKAEFVDPKLTQAETWELSKAEWQSR